MVEWAGSVDAVSQSDNWIAFGPWDFSERRDFSPRETTVFAIAELEADAAYNQGLYVSGLENLRLNGNLVEPELKDFYSLDLMKGTNVLELEISMLSEKAKNRRLSLSKVDLEYMNPTRDKILEDARLAIEFLGSEYPDYPAAAYLERLGQLARGGAAIEEIDVFRREALVLENPEVKFDRILFRNSRSTKFPANWQGNSTLLRRKGEEFQPSFNDAFRILDLASGEVETIYEPADPREGLMDICLDFDASKFLYSGIDPVTNTFHVYEMNIDGTGKRQVTTYLPEIDHYNGIYLPNGKILFCSTASLNSVPCVGGSDYVGTLYEMNANGTGMRQVCFDQENDWYPWVKENGRVQYARWEYTDNSHYFTRILLEMNPDGTANRSIYGSNSYWPNTIFYAKQTPGNTSKFSAIVSGHHGASRAGELVVFDQSKGDFEADGVVQRIPGRGKEVKPVIIDDYTAGRYPRFMHPYPLSEHFFLVSGQMKPGDRWAIYLVDIFDNMIPLYSGKTHMYEPVPIMERPVPPVIPDRRIQTADTGTLFIQDIYEGPGLAGVPRGTVAALRIFTYGYAYRLNGSHDTLAIEGGWDTKRVLGTVPVEEDGSVMVKVPANLPLSMQPLDKNGDALQVMRSWTVAQRGEVVSCVGCHEPSRAAPVARMTLAARKPPQELTPWSKVGRPYGYGFKREIQPILDRYCVGCHDGTFADRPNFYDNSEEKFNAKAIFSNAYMALHPYVRRPGPESDLHVLTPMDYHVSTSPLFQMLEKGHHGVELDDASRRELAIWADLNVPYHATWTEVRNDEYTQEIAARTVEYKERFSGLQDNIEWMPPLPTERPDFIQPQAVEAPEPVRIDDWPLELVERSEIQTIHFNGHKLDFVRIPAGRYVMGSVSGSPDEYPQTVVEIEKPFLMSTTEITNEQFRAFMPDHNSKVIDQQWKDHIFPGYPANEPQMPVIRVTWEEAMAFTEWLSAQTGQHVTLPTEAQWEWAARGGSDQPFFFGQSGFEKFANLADKNIAFLAVRGVNPQPVPERSRTPLNDFVPRDDSFDDGVLVPSGTAQYLPNPWGLFDMHGNVAEWTRTSYRPYPYDAHDGRNNLSATEKKVVRGGSWRDKPKYATASHRLMYAPYQKVFNVGFRVVIEAEPEDTIAAAF